MKNVDTLPPYLFLSDLEGKDRFAPLQVRGGQQVITTFANFHLV